MSIEQLGRYRIDGKLGEGAMGVVYRAFDPLLERIVAIKTIRFDLGDQEDFERRFFREAKSAARLNHPAIVTVFDAGKVDDMAYIAMEFLEGRDLRQLLRSEPEGGQRLPYDRIAELIAAVADGLDYAHQAGVVHRDVKPANIIVLDGSTNTGAVKLADFGIAQLQSSAKTMTGTMLGTPKYMAPEQIMGQAVDGRADIFSLGVVLYQLLTGTAPFDGETVSTIMYRVIHEGARRPSLVQGDVPPGFEAILAKALAKKPEDRYASAA
ncbi:MAG TPA: serine/threonine-protein kinase, partial [Azospira sp.]|nr:serine/threonine-protein kinase [Azospira sp.]